MLLDSVKKGWVGLLLCPILIWLLFWIGFHPTAYVQHHYNNRNEQTSWVWVDAITQSSLGSFDGFLHLPDSRRLWIENTAGANIVFTINGVIVYNGSASTLVNLPSDIPSTAPFTFV